MMLIQFCMLLQKQLNLNSELNQNRKENLTKITNQSRKLILKSKLKRWEKEMTILSEIKRNKDSKPWKFRKLIRKCKITNVVDIPSIKEELKRKTQVKAERERRFDKRNKFYKQNKVFQADGKKFSREIEKK